MLSKNFWSQYMVRMLLPFEAPSIAGKLNLYSKSNKYLTYCKRAATLTSSVKMVEGWRTPPVAVKTQSLRPRDEKEAVWLGQ